MTWVAIFISLQCPSCGEQKVGEFSNQVECLRWVNHAQRKFPWYRGVCKEEKRPV